MNLYNTLSRKVEIFESIGDEVNVYACGITPYDTTHLGHAFTYTCVDILIRYLELRGLTVRYVQNVTDIDDDILRKAKELGENWLELGNRWTAHFIRDMQSLNVRPPDHYPRATDVIPEIVHGVESLLNAGVAYESGGSVYFDISAWPEFGKLSALSREEMLPIANERGNKPDDPHKRNPLDFVLWQRRSSGEPAWDSPWGSGRPGWHIECSTMSTQILGPIIDVHCGGADLCFPHHECEIAQVEPISEKKPFVRYWMHAAMVYHDGVKMSKSLGNLVMVRDLLKTYSPDALRLYLSGHHYRQIWSHDEGELIKAEEIAHTLQEAVTAGGGAGKLLDANPAWAAFSAALDNDLDTPEAQQVLFSLAQKILEAASLGRRVAGAQDALRRMGQVFGLRMEEKGAEARVIENWNKILIRFS
ncbi:MAG TPA: cysteine--tRNA ligase [Anaerolineales bacterium]|nr:cysteine--tRNA ligase [Anaerolineales bacterium]